ncbi:MAG: ribosomal RNA small subunit methyltransferase A [Rhodothermales bacterium]|nr:ribosomal RNA small subunit methyltransferase A [Rhodothermales bacterium]
MNLKPIKHLGQNFLSDPNIARKIVDGLEALPGDPVVEIGPGTGALTALLADRFEHLTVIEIDYRAAELLRTEHPGIRVIEGDVLETDWPSMAAAAGGRLHVIGNLPYNITSEIVFGLLDASDSIAEAVMMVQYDVARRFAAVPRTKEYGILSVAAQLSADVEMLFPVSRNVFYPRPDVRSAVVRFDFGNGVAAGLDADPAWIRKEVRELVRTAFNQRRKTLRNSLSSITDRVGLDLPENVSGRRAEELEPYEYVDLARYLLPPG